jgi:hypothetical protein
MTVQVKKHCGKCQKHKHQSDFEEGSKICKVCVANRKAAMKNIKRGVNQQIGARSF